MKYEQKQLVNYHKYAGDITRDEGLKLMKVIVNKGDNMKLKITGSCLSLGLAIVFILILFFLYPAGW